jgi:hypothetical protein
MSLGVATKTAALAASALSLVGAAAAAAAAAWAGLIAAALKDVSSAADIGLKNPFEDIGAPLAALGAGLALVVAGTAAFATFSFALTAVAGQLTGMFFPIIAAINLFGFAVMGAVAVIPLLAAGVLGLGAAMLMWAQQSTAFQERIAPVVDLISQKYYDLFGILTTALEPALGAFYFVLTQLGPIMQAMLAPLVPFIAGTLFNTFVFLANAVGLVAMGLLHLANALPFVEVDGLISNVQAVLTELNSLGVDEGFEQFKLALAEATEGVVANNEAAKQVNLPEIVNLERLRREASGMGLGAGGAASSITNPNFGDPSRWRSPTTVIYVQLNGETVETVSEFIEGRENFVSYNGRNSTGRAYGGSTVMPRSR